MSEINVMDFVEAMNAKNTEVTQANAERERLYQELREANKRSLEFADEVDRLVKELDKANATILRQDGDLEATAQRLRDANLHQENLRELLAGF
jgi:septal ring factor EnvC (AmiA/AmiB activator)